MILAEWAEKAWGLMVLREQTLKNYRYKFDKHLYAHFGHQEIGAVTRKDVQLWVLNQPPTIGRACLPVLSSVFRVAEDYDLVPANPCLGVKKKPHVVPERSHGTCESSLGCWVMSPRM